MTDIEARPYCGPAPTAADLASAWNLDPLLIAAFSAAVVAHLIMRRRVAGPPARDRWAALGLGALAVAFVSPLCAATVALFSARALHHLVVLGVAAPALALAWPWLRAPAGLAAALVAAALVVWHLPAAYALAWGSPSVYWLMQAALLLPAWAFWSAVLVRPAGGATLLGNALLVAGLAGVMGMIGAILTFAPAILYPEHIAGAAAFGLDALGDQQLAGLVMWVPGFVPFVVVAWEMLRRGWRRGFAA